MHSSNQLFNLKLLIFSPSVSPMLPLPSHGWGKQKEVGGQQALKMLIIHTAAKRQRAKGAGSHYQPHCIYACVCVSVCVSVCVCGEMLSYFFEEWNFF